MILQALNEYYQRKTSDPDPVERLAPPGFQWIEIPFIIVLDLLGHPVQILDMRSSNNGIQRVRPLLVPQDVGRSSNIEANLLWDKASYSLGVNIKTDATRLKKQHTAFVEKARALLDNSKLENKAAFALLSFLNNIDYDRLLKESVWKEILEKDPNITFQILGDPVLICQKPEILSLIEEGGKNDSEQLICLITGRNDTVAIKHPKTPIFGSKSNAKFVSFNDPAYNSFGKKQGTNAPISQSAAFAYTTALNHLLRKGSRQRIQVGDATT